MSQCGCFRRCLCGAGRDGQRRPVRLGGVPIGPCWALLDRADLTTLKSPTPPTEEMTDEVISTDIIPSEEIEHEIEEIETSSQEDQKELGISEAKRFKLDLGENLEHLPLSSGTMQRPISKLTTGPRQGYHFAA